MPKKKPRLTEAEVHAMIVRDAKLRLGYKDFEPEFTLYPTPDDQPEWRANWGLWRVVNVPDWAPDCAEAFMEAIQRARMKFDIAWPRD